MRLIDQPDALQRPQRRHAIGMRKEPQGAAPAGDAAEAAGQHVGKQREAAHPVELLETDADVYAPGLRLRATSAVGLGLFADQRATAGAPPAPAIAPAHAACDGTSGGRRRPDGTGP